MNHWKQRLLWAAHFLVVATALVGLAPHAVSQSTEVENTSDYDWFSTPQNCTTGLGIASIVQQGMFTAFDMAREVIRPLAAADEAEIGRDIHEMIVSNEESPFYGRPMDSDPQLVGYLQSLVDQLTLQLIRPDVRYTVHVIDADEAINAFAVPGGNIYVLSGLLRQPGYVQNEAQLMAILAHEVSHNDLRHTMFAFESARVAGLSDGQLSVLFVRAVGLAARLYSRETELEADEYAISRLVALGYSPFQLPVMWETWSTLGNPSDGHSMDSSIRPPPQVVLTVLEELEVLAQSHPTLADRACLARQRVNSELAQSDQASWYVGRTNLTRRISAAHQRF